MSYAIALHKYHTKRAPRGVSARFEGINENKILAIGVCAIVVLAVLYAAEANTLMFLKRSVPMKEKIALEAKNDVQGLAIQATQLQSSQKVQEIALSKEMVFLDAVSYVNAGDTSVAMAGTTLTR
ncbi:MAG: hypothetical protein AAB630_02390 [Patescibacteria group bacterium]